MAEERRAVVEYGKSKVAVRHEDGDAAEGGGEPEGEGGRDAEAGEATPEAGESAVQVEIRRREGEWVEEGGLWQVVVVVVANGETEMEKQVDGEWGHRVGADEDCTESVVVDGAEPVGGDDVVAVEGLQVAEGHRRPAWRRREASEQEVQQAAQARLEVPAEEEEVRGALVAGHGGAAAPGVDPREREGPVAVEAGRISAAEVEEAVGQAAVADQGPLALAPEVEAVVVAGEQAVLLPADLPALDPLGQVLGQLVVAALGHLRHHCRHRHRRRRRRRRHRRRRRRRRSL